MTDIITADAIRIAQFNDDFRQAGPLAGNWHITAGIHENGPAFVAAVLARTRAHDAFTPDNDPHGEHDFGSFEIAGKKLFWKIDYYGMTFDHGSENPADPAITTHVMTIMLASEY